LTLKEAALYLGQNVRWLRRHYVNLIKGGVIVYRIPRGAIKGRLMFGKSSLDEYIERCRLKMGSGFHSNL
jgi:hypothetical protein